MNGNHSNDAVIVKRYHLWGRKNNIPTSTIHDAFFANTAEKKTIEIRSDNAQWTSRSFEIWMIKWPNLLSSFESITTIYKKELL